MSELFLVKENIANLDALWRLMGAQVYQDNTCIQVSKQWPYRCWYDWEASIENIATLECAIDQASALCIVPVWETPGDLAVDVKRLLIANGFDVLFEQTAMYLALQNDSLLGSDLFMKSINSEEDIERWISIAEASFAYEIDSSVIHQVANDDNVKLLMACVDNCPVATALLFKTGEVIGVHQLGVLKEYRGQGIARQLMHDVINLSVGWSGRYLSLQASKDGEALYQSLGFQRQFVIKNYQRPVTGV
ncbi:MAG: GNAT family N-acetyltransferase [Spongiibacteraceae bacterium]|nr:GNAT family N-acetyltransferase [Spongiibacteraceae bacterium]